MADTGSYLYAVSRGLSEADVRGLLGLRQQPVRLVDHRGLSAVVSDVALDEFGDEGLRTHLEDLAWLEDVARTHDEVVLAVAALAPTAPLRLATICLTDAGVRERLDQWHDPLVRTLDRVQGHQEWSVKAFAPSASPQTSPPSAPKSQPESEAESEAPGAAYLKRRKAETEQRNLAGERAAELADQLHASLSQASTASRRLNPQDQRLTGHEGTMILNGAYLVDSSDLGRFQTAVQELSDANPEARLELQGPWPAYSFVSLDEQ